MKSKMISLVAWFIVSVLFVSIFTSCNIRESNQTTIEATTSVVEQKKIPDITGVEITDGKNVLTSMGFIPVIEYKYDDYIEKGIIMRTEPDVGQLAICNSKVTIYVSNGASLITSQKSWANWKYIGANEDEWEFNNPYIEDEVLYIECYNVIFGTAMKWQDRYNEGVGGGIVSINDTYDKTVPIIIRYSNQAWKAGDAQSITIEVPLSDLDVEKPTDLYFKLAAVDGNNYKDIQISFSITW